MWLERVARTYPAAVWLNPVPEKEWDFTYSIGMVRQLMGGRMYPLTLEGLGSSDAGVGAVKSGVASPLRRGHPRSEPRRSSFRARRR